MSVVFFFPRRLAWSVLGLMSLLCVQLSLASTGVVKLSRSHICHLPGSHHYSRTIHFTPFESLQACQDAGGRLPRGRSGQHASGNSTDKYSRDQFGSGWADLDSNCQNTRHQLLATQSTAPVRFRDTRQCQVTAGRWISLFTGAVIHDPSVMDIDHLVPLKWAWERGAQSWTRAQRVRFANDPVNLLSVEASLNRQKGASGPDQWLPPANQCQYLARYLRVVKKYRLAVPDSEQNQYRQIRQRVC